jgi:hypothetical protein
MTTKSTRPAPPPVVDPNPPRPAPAEASSTVAVTPAPAQPTGETAFVTNVGTNVGNSVPDRPGPTAATTLDALLYGRTDPDQDRGQTGVRLPKYVTDAVRVIAATSGGRLAMQDVVTEAVKAFLPADVLRAAYVRHGGNPDQ